MTWHDFGYSLLFFFHTSIKEIKLRMDVLVEIKSVLCFIFSFPPNQDREDMFYYSSPLQSTSPFFTFNQTEHIKLKVVIIITHC